MSRHLIDSGLLIRHLRKHKPTVQFIRGLMKFGPLSIATVTRLEIYAGMRPNERYDTQKFLSRFIHFDLNRHIAQRAGDYIYASQLTGKQLGVPDAIIAATATVHDLTLVTLNVGDFGAIPGLSLYPLPDWS